MGSLCEHADHLGINRFLIRSGFAVFRLSPLVVLYLRKPGNDSL